MKLRLEDLRSWTGPTSHGEYAAWGGILCVIKLALDHAIAALFFGREWGEFDLDRLHIYLWQSLTAPADEPFYLAMLGASLPFLWAGVVLTLRRLRSLDWPAWLVLLFFVPALKLVLFALLCMVPAEPNLLRATESIEDEDSVPRSSPVRSFIASASFSMSVTAALTVGAVWLGVEGSGHYGFWIFVANPFTAGILSVLLYTSHEPRTRGASLGVACGMAFSACAGLIALGYEGAVCLVMAAPLVIPIVCFGGAVGYAIRQSFRAPPRARRLYSTILVLLPLGSAIEYAVPPSLPSFEVMTSIVVDAPPETVWRHVVSFPELPPPRELLFRAGVAYPMGATIDGDGAGAVRRCRFSTGSFVEPIEVWDPPRVLHFAVTSQPAPLVESSPYDAIHPPHLDGYLVTTAGEFRLTPAGGGRTRLDGTTWYRNRMWPTGYWRLWSDAILHAIHRRVLVHIRDLAERS